MKRTVGEALVGWAELVGGWLAVVLTPFAIFVLSLGAGFYLGCNVFHIPAGYAAALGLIVGLTLAAIGERLYVAIWNTALRLRHHH